MPKKTTDYLSVQKALQILLSFVPHNTDMGTTELSERLGLHKSTVSRLLNVLAGYGFLQRDAATRKFRLGISAAKISTAVKQSLSEHLIGIAQPHIDNLRTEIGETVALEVWSENSTVMAYRAEMLRLKRAYQLRLGDRVDVHVSAGARIILAFLPPRTVDHVLQGPFERFTENTVVDPKILKSMIRKARNDGYAISKGERHPDSHVVAVPIFDYEKRPVAAISLFTTFKGLQEMLETDIMLKLYGAAASISTNLLYSEENETPFSQGMLS